MTWPSTEWQWGPFWLPGLYDYYTNWPSIKIVMIIGFIVFYRYFSGAPPRIFYSKKRLDGKVAIVTGCNRGIGKETVKDLARRGCRVIMACRNTTEAHKAKDEIVECTKNTNIFVYKLDLSSFKSIRTFAKEFLEQESRLDILIHNAGYYNFSGKRSSEDGLELTMAINYYGPFLLTHLLIPMLRKTVKSRIVVVASDLHRFAKLDLENLNPINGFSHNNFLASKNASMMFTVELARRLKGTGIIANSVHPGMVNTDHWKNIPYPLSSIMNFMRKFMKTAHTGAQTILCVAVGDDVNGITGQYFMEMRPEKMRAQVTNEEDNRLLWEKTVKMVKLTDDDPKI